MADDRQAMKGRVEPELDRIMGSDEQVTVGVLAARGPFPEWGDLLWLLLLLLACVNLAVVVRAGLSAHLPGLLRAGTPVLLLGGAMERLSRRPVFLVVTNRRIICLRLSRIANRPVGRPVFIASIGAATLIPAQTILPGHGAARYRGPGASPRGLRLMARGGWRQDLAQAIAAL
jgi:hypothetical protein